MVKSIKCCDICHQYTNTYNCKFCLHKFCLDCLSKNHSTEVINTIVNDIKELESQDSNSISSDSSNSLEDEPVLVQQVEDTSVNAETFDYQDEEAMLENCNISKKNNYNIKYCAFKCIRSWSHKHCFDCGGRYMNMKKCLCCHTIFCSLCQKKNLLNAKKITNQQLSQAYFFCSKSCYEIFMEQPNNSWCVCEDCGEEYYDIGYRRCCELCIHRHRFNKDHIYNLHRVTLKSKLKIYILKKNLNLEEIEEILHNSVIEKVKTYSNISGSNIKLKDWYDCDFMGDNLCYNIWDEVLDEFLMSNKN